MEEKVANSPWKRSKVTTLYGPKSLRTAIKELGNDAVFLTQLFTKNTYMRPLVPDRCPDTSIICHTPTSDHRQRGPRYLLGTLGQQRRAAVLVPVVAVAAQAVEAAAK